MNFGKVSALFAFAITSVACALAGQEIERTLPEVLVQPAPQEPTSEELATSGSPRAEDASNQSPANAEVQTNYDTQQQATNLQRTYPNLSQLEFSGSNSFGGTGGVMRQTTSLFDSPAAGQIVTRQQIVEKQSSDMANVLQHEVGVLMQSTAAGQASPFIRGLTGQQVLILVDGVRLNNSIFRFGPNQYFNTIDPGMVDHVEVLRGQGSVLWGSDAIGGVINVETRSADSHYGLCHGVYSGVEFQQTFNTSNSASYSRGNYEAWCGATGIFAGTSYFNARDLDTGFDFGRQPGTNFQQYAGDVKINRMITRDQMLTVSLQHFEQQDLPRSDRFPGYPGDLNASNTREGARFFDPQQRDLTYVRYQAIDVSQMIDALSFTASYHRQREIQTRGIPTTRSQETDVDSVGLNLVAAKEFGDFGKVTTGVDWYHDDIDSNFAGTANGPIIPDDAFYERIGSFLNWDVLLTDRLAAVAGVRYENIDLGGTPIVAGTPVPISPSFQDWVSSIGLNYELAPSVRLVGSIAEGFRAPNLDELTANNPNVLQEGEDLPSLGLSPESSVTYEIGVKTNSNRLRTQTFIYWMDLDDNIVPVVAGANQFQRANQDSKIQGVEFDGELLLDGGWSLYGNAWYTYGRNKVTGGALSRIPPTQGILGLRRRTGRIGDYFAIYAWMVNRQDRLDPVRDIGDERIPIGGTPGYATLNARLGKSFGCNREHRVSVNLINITDKAYLVHGSGVYGTGFTATLGYTFAY